MVVQAGWDTRLCSALVCIRYLCVMPLWCPPYKMAFCVVLIAGFDFIVLIDMDTSVWRDGVLLVY